MKESSDIESSSAMNFMNKKVKSELFNIWKKARVMFDMIKDDDSLEDWQKKNIREAHDLLNESMTYSEYEKIFPKEKESVDEGENNFLSNKDKRFPSPVSQETGDEFITRCILDANMKKKHPVQSDRFQACMGIYNEKQTVVSENPGEKFQDPLACNDPELPDPVKPLIP